MPNQPTLISKRFILWSTGIILLIMGLGATLFFVGKFYAGDILNEVIKRETNGFYQLNFKSLEFDVFESRIKVNDLQLNADSTKNFTSLGLNNIYEIQLDELIIDLESIYALYLDKELIIKNVRVVDPDIKMVSLDNAGRTDFSFEAGNMYQAISDYLQVLKIDYFRIQDGDLQYDGNQFSLGEIDFIMKNLLMDSTSRENQVFYSEQIELEIRNQLFHLPDSIHEVTFDKFVLSTSDSVLSFDNLRVKPLKTSGVTFEGQNEVNVYDIHVPKLIFKGVDYVAAYQSNHLIIDELILDEPTVFVDDESHAAGTKKDIDNSLLTLIFNIFGSLDVAKLTVNNAHVDIKIDKQDKYQRLKVEESSLVFYNIHLDTSNYRFDHRFKYFEDIELDIHNYTYLLPDSTHTVNFELLQVSSFDSKLVFKNMQVSHERAGNETKVLVDAEIPNFRLENVDFQRAIADKVLIVGALEMSDAMLKVRNTGSKSNNKDASIKSVYRAIAPFFREVSIDQLSVNEMSLTLPKGIGFGQIGLDINGVHLSAASNSFKSLFNDSQVQASNFTFDQDSIQVRGSLLLLDDRMSAFQLVDWDIDVDTKDQQIKGRFDSLQITTVNIDSLIGGKYTSFRRAILINPDVEFNIQRKKGSEKLQAGIEKELIIAGGKVKGNVDSLQLSMGGLDADIFIGDSTAFRRVAIENINIRSMQYNHNIGLEKWRYDTLNSEMEFYNLMIEPIDIQDTLKMQIQAAIPYLKLTEFEQSKFFDENHLFTDVVQMVRPDIRLKIPRSKRVSDSSKSESTLTMAIKQLRIDTANISLLPQGSSEVDSLVLSGLTTRMYEWSYPRDTPILNGSVYSETMDLTIQEFIPYMSSKDSLRFKNTTYSSISNDLAIDSIVFASSEKNLRFQIPSIQFKNLNLESLHNNGHVEMDSLMINETVGVMHLLEGDGEKAPFTTPVNISHVSLANMKWTLKDTLNDIDYHLRNGSLKVDNFISEDTLTALNLMNQITRLSFNAGPFEMPVEDYTLALDSYQFDYPASRVKLNDVQLIPKYTAEEYSDKISKQSDWFDILIGDVTIDQIDIAKLLTFKEYDVQMIDINDVDALIYRDKAIPFPESQVRHLPQHYIRELSTSFHIDTINMNGSIRYREKPENYFTYGEISFDDIDVSLLNVGNMNLSTNDVMLLNASGKLMEVGKIDVNGAFNLTDENESFSLNGSVKDFPLDSMNRMLGPVANVNIKSGYARDLYFNFAANDTLSRGDMRFRYNDLKIQILNTKTHDTQGFGQGIKTFFANTFVVKNKNPSYLLFLRKGTIFQRRDTSRAIFNYWGKSLLSGAVSSIGVHKSDKAEKKFERQID